MYRIDYISYMLRSIEMVKIFAINPLVKRLQFNHLKQYGYSMGNFKKDDLLR